MIKFLVLNLVLVVWSVHATAVVEDDDQEFIVKDDMIIVEAAEQPRGGRQLMWYNNPYSQEGSHWPVYHLMNPCLKKSGEMGRCTTLKSCYPFYNIRSDVPQWAYGSQDTCSYLDPMGYQTVYGVCCQSNTRASYWPGIQGHPFWQSPQRTPQYPGFGPQYPGAGAQYPGAVAQQPVGGITIPGTENGWPPPLPIPAGWPGTVGGIPAPQPVLPPQQPQPPITTAPPTTTTTESAGVDFEVVEDNEPPAAEVPSGGSGDYSACGVARHPIRYNQDGQVVEEEQRITGEHPLRVVNGWPADRNEWPWIVGLMNRGRQFCGGSLISDRHILTAAHCVAQMTRQDVATLTIRLGAHEIKNKYESGVVEKKVKRVVRHKGFSSETLHWDVAVITLESPVEFGPTIRKVCLDTGRERHAESLATVVGWGSLGEGKPQPDILMEVTLQVWDNPRCKQFYGQAAPGGITDHMLCAGKKNKDSCSGDSGGPMVIGAGNTWKQIGIVSWGIGCGKSDYPGVYTRVAEVIDWIEKAKTS